MMTDVVLAPPAMSLDVRAIAFNVPPYLVGQTFVGITLPTRVIAHVTPAQCVEMLRLGFEPVAGHA